MGYVYSKNSVKESIDNNNVKLLYLNSADHPFFRIAKEKKINYKIVSDKELDKLIGVKTKVLHQGVVALVNDYKYYSLEEVISNNDNHSDNHFPLLVMLDSLDDPHNLGAILRICDAAGVDGVIIGKNRSTRLNETVARTSTGAIEWVKVCEVTNLTQTIRYLKEKGYFIVGAEYEEKSVMYDKCRYDMSICLVIGSEGFGVSELVKKNCDFLVKIPMLGHVNSLNASVSCGILVYEILRNRNQK